MNTSYEKGGADFDLGMTDDDAIEMLDIEDLDELSGDGDQDDDQPAARKKAEKPEPKAQDADDDGDDETDEDVVEEKEADQDQDEDEPETLTLDALADALDMTVDDLKGQIQVTRKVNGEEEVVTLAELQAGNQREADYTRKTMEHAENVRQWEQARQAQEQAVAQQYQNAVGMAETMQQQLLQEYQAVNWAELESVDPGQAALQRQKYQEQFNHLQQVQQNATNALQQQALYHQQQEHQRWAEYVAEQAKRLPTVIPEWSSEDVATREKREIAEYLLANGIDQQRIDSIGQAEQLAIARKAMLWDRSQAKGKAVTQRVKKLPKLAKSGKKLSKGEQSQSKRREALKRFRKSGRMRDAIDAIPDELVM